MRSAAAVVVVAVAAVDTDCYDYNCWYYSAYYCNYHTKTWWCLVCLTRFPGGSWRETFLRVWTNEIIRWEQKVVYSGFPTRFQKRGKTTLLAPPGRRSRTCARSFYVECRVSVCEIGPNDVLHIHELPIHILAGATVGFAPVQNL